MWGCPEHLGRFTRRSPGIPSLGVSLARPPRLLYFRRRDRHTAHRNGRHGSNNPTSQSIASLGTSRLFARSIATNGMRDAVVSMPLSCSTASFDGHDGLLGLLGSQRVLSCHVSLHHTRCRTTCAALCCTSHAHTIARVARCNIADFARIDRINLMLVAGASMALLSSTTMPRQPRRPAGPVSQHAVQHVLSRNAYLQPTAPLRPSQPLLVDADVAALASLCFCGPSQR